jgi:hypothetical protein
MGFRDLRAFNIALLAKQNWRIQTQPQSLMARTLKAKYFPQTSLWKAKPKQGINYSWRSILQVNWVIKKGSYWAVGNGESINIWQDNWLPNQNGYKVSAPYPLTVTYIKSVSLLNIQTLAGKLLYSRISFSLSISNT